MSSSPAPPFARPPGRSACAGEVDARRIPVLRAGSSFTPSDTRFVAIVPTGRSRRLLLPLAQRGGRQRPRWRRSAVGVDPCPGAAFRRRKAGYATQPVRDPRSTGSPSEGIFEMLNRRPLLCSDRSHAASLALIPLAAGAAAPRSVPLKVDFTLTPAQIDASCKGRDRHGRQAGGRAAEGALGAHVQDRGRAAGERDRRPRRQPGRADLAVPGGAGQIGARRLGEVQQRAERLLRAELFARADLYAALSAAAKSGTAARHGRRSCWRST